MAELEKETIRLDRERYTRARQHCGRENGRFLAEAPKGEQLRMF